MGEYVIETRNLSKIYSKDTVVNSVDMHVEKGKIYGLLGKNENLTAYENLKVLAKLRGNYNPQNINLVLEMVNLENAKSKKFKDFSLGMKQRLGIAAAIMHTPELLILDEPINGLDPIGIKEIRTLLKRLTHEFGITILISSHILSEIENIADVIGFMDEGVLIEEISKEDLFKRLDKFVEFEVSDIDLACNILKKLELKENYDFVIDRNEGILRLYSRLELRDRFNAIFVNSGINVKKVNLCEENLENFFLRMIQNN